MSQTFYLTDGVTLPVKITDPDGLKQFKELISVMRTYFTDREESDTRSTFLEKLENMNDIAAVSEFLFIFKNPTEVALGDYVAILKAIDYALTLMNPRHIHYLDITVDDTEQRVTVMLWIPSTTDRVETEDNEADISADTKAVVSDEIKEVVKTTFSGVAQERAEIGAIGNDPGPTTDSTKKATEDPDWITPTRGTIAQASVKPETQTESIPTTTNKFGSLSDDDDDEYDEYEGSRGMEQSMEEPATDIESSPEKVSKTEQTMNEELINRKDYRLRDKGWSKMNRMIGKGDLNQFGAEDICFYYHGGPKAMKQARKIHVDGFDTDIAVKLGDTEIELNKTCNNIVDKAVKALNVEDGAVFNKIRVNHNKLDAAIDKSNVQLVKQNRANENSHAIMADMDNRMKIKESNFKKITENFATKVESLETDLVKCRAELKLLHTKVNDFLVHKPTVAPTEEKDADHSAPSKDTTHESMKEPDKVASSFGGFDEFGDPRPGPDTEKVIPYGSRVILKNGIMSSCHAYHTVRWTILVSCSDWWTNGSLCSPK